MTFQPTSFSDLNASQQSLLNMGPISGNTRTLTVALRNYFGQVIPGPRVVSYHFSTDALGMSTTLGPANFVGAATGVFLINDSKDILFDNTGALANYTGRLVLEFDDGWRVTDPLNLPH